MLEALNTAVRHTFMEVADSNYPERTVAVMVTALPHSSAPAWEKTFDQADIRLYDLN